MCEALWFKLYMQSRLKILLSISLNDCRKKLFLIDLRKKLDSSMMEPKEVDHLYFDPRSYPMLHKTVE